MLFSLHSTFLIHHHPEVLLVWFLQCSLCISFMFSYLSGLNHNLLSNSRHSSNVVLLFSPFTFSIKYTACPHLQILSQYSSLSINLMVSPPSSNSSYNLGSSKLFSGWIQDIPPKTDICLNIIMLLWPESQFNLSLVPNGGYIESYVGLNLVL